MRRQCFLVTGLAVLAAAAISAGPGRAQCAAPVLDHAYQTDDGETVNVYRFPTYVNWNCFDSYYNSIDKHLMSGGNSTGTLGVEVAPSGPKRAEHCTVRMTDGTAMMMKGLPRITGGRFVFNDAFGHLLQVPLKEVVSTDSGKRFRCKTCTLDGAGKPVGNPAVKEAFARANPCPATGRLGTICPGYVVDHVTPLACGGDDEAANLQWQTAAEVKRKEAWSETACGP